MKPYKDLNGDSGVRAYEFTSDSITVEFKDGSRYVYTNASAGAEAVERMKQLAERGDGLNSYISRHVRKNYQSKLR